MQKQAMPPYYDDDDGFPYVKRVNVFLNHYPNENNFSCLNTFMNSNVSYHKHMFVDDTINDDASKCKF